MAIRGINVQEEFGYPELHKILVHNPTTSDIAAGVIVYVSGARGARRNAQLSVRPATSAAGQAATNQGWFLVTQQIIKAGGEGIATDYAVVEIDATGLAAGAPLFLADATPGTFTATKGDSTSNRLVGHVGEQGAGTANGCAVLCPSNIWGA